MILVLGDADDARGFALAGASVVRCRTRENVLRSLRPIDAGDLAPTLVMASARVYALAPADLDRLRDRRTGPVVLILPETPMG